ncbi:hypothetical protein Tco_1285001 [Tanacetum coccineum]
MKQDKAQQAAYDEKLVPSDDRVKISKSNLRMDPLVTQKEETYQVVLDIIKNTPCYNAFLISANNSEAYKTFIGISTGLIPPKKGRCKGAQGTKAVVIPNKATSASKKKKQKKKVSIRDESITKKKSIEPSQKQKLKGIELLSESAQFEIDTYKAMKASKRTSIFQHQSNGLSEGAALGLEVPDEPSDKSAYSDKGAGTSSEVLDESKDKNEKIEDIPWKFIDDDESEDDDEEDESEDDKAVKGVAEMNIAEEAKEDNTKRVEEQKDDEELKANEEQKGDDQFGDEQLVFINSPNASLIGTIPENAEAEINSLFTELEKAVKELKQADHSTTILASIISQVPSVVKEYLRSIPLDAFQKAVKEALEKIPPSLDQSSSQGQSTIQAAESLSKYKLKKVPYEKMHKTQSHLTHDTHQELYDALTWSMLLDEATTKESDKPDKVLKKRDRGDDQDKDPSDGSNQGKKTKNRRVNDSESSKKTSTTKESSKARHEQEIHNRLKRLNERKLQIQDCMVQKVKASDASSGEKDCIRIVSKKKSDQGLENQSNTSGDESSMSRNECNDKRTYGDDTDIRPSYDTEQWLSNVIPDSPDMCDNDIQTDQKAIECDDERVKANTSLAHKLKECQSILAETSRTMGESNSIRDSCLIALQNKQTELETYKTLNDRIVDYDKLEHKLNETLGLLAQKEIDIKEGLNLKAYEILVVKEKHDELVKQSFLTKSHYEGLVKEKTKVITDLKLKEEKDIDKMISMEKQLKFLNEIVYKKSQSIQTIHMLAPKGPTFNDRPTLANLIYLKKVQSEKPCLYEIPYDQSDPTNRLVPNREETLTLEKESRSKLNKDLVRPYDYTKLNSLYEIFKPATQEYHEQLAHANEDGAPQLTTACRSHVSPRGSATSADWVPLAYVAATSSADVAATSSADVAEGILALKQI